MSGADRLTMKCTLLTDVVMSETSASTGNMRGLDFIPGNNFLGIVAGQLYNEVSPEVAFQLFHSGEVHFGDAHPSKEGARGLRVPASVYFPKGAGLSEGPLFIHHRVSEENKSKYQLKQARSGFYTYKVAVADEVEVEKDYSQKSAHDLTLRRSEDSKMFGYTALVKGLELFFTIAFEPSVSADLRELVQKSLVGNHYVGRSRSAEYGRVKIELCSFDEVPTGALGGDYTTVYADGRLIFIDEESGLPTLQPTREQLGFASGDICWELCQLRTFQYAPWNYKRQSYDADRYGIEKGSVFVLKGVKELPQGRFVGSYQQEGFGAVIYNPYFLDAEEGSGGLVRIKYQGAKTYETHYQPTSAITFTPQVAKQVEQEQAPLRRYLNLRQKYTESQNAIYREVNNRVQKWSQGGGVSASQWGSIRSLAMAYSGEDLKTQVLAFISHGVSKGQWEDSGLDKKLKEFMEGYEGSGQEGSSAQLKDALINLSAEMAKKSKK